MFKIHDSLINCAAFLGVRDSDGVIRPRGTAFYVVVPFRHDKTIGRGYLVTAKHNIEKSAGFGLYVSINPKFQGKFDQPKWLDLPFDLIWHTHRDDISADVVVADWRPEHEYYSSYTGILVSSFLEFQPSILGRIGSGCETRTIGLFAHHAGTKRHTPLVRAGNVSLYPTDDVLTNRGYVEAYIVESRSIGGLSGSPVFILDFNPPGMIWHPLLGLNSGHWDFAVGESSEGVSRVNSGMAVVLPAKKIADILFYEELVEARKAYDCMDLDDLCKNRYDTHIYIH